MAKNKTSKGFLAKICLNNRLTVPHLEAALLGLSTGDLVLVCIERVEPWMVLNAKTGLNALGDRELGALIRASPLYPILIEFEKEETAAKTCQEFAAKSSQDVIHSQTI